LEKEEKIMTVAEPAVSFASDREAIIDMIRAMPPGSLIDDIIDALCLRRDIELRLKEADRPSIPVREVFSRIDAPLIQEQARHRF